MILCLKKVKGLAPGPDLKTALRSPVGSAPLADLLSSLKGGKTLVTIAVDDYTRTTPVRRLIPEILSLAKKCGIPGKQVRILIGNGIHRPMTKPEIRRRLGAAVSSCRVLNHDAFDEKGLSLIGTSAGGTPILVNRLVTESDFVMAVGQIAPHRVAGFSGGSKMIQPGLCGLRITDEVHWRGWMTPTEDIFGIRDNPVREEMDRIAEKARLKFIVNVVMRPDGPVHGIYAGDPVLAHREGAFAARRLYGVPASKADIVITDSHPCDADLNQAAKAASPAEMIMKKGGSVILVTPCPEKVSRGRPQLPDGLKYQPLSSIIRGVETGAIRNRLIASHMAAFGRILENGRLILVSPSFSRRETEALGFGWAKNAREALADERKRLGKDASVCEIRQGGKLLPLMEEDKK